jgi:hypothetical protein
MKTLADVERIDHSDKITAIRLEPIMATIQAHYDRTRIDRQSGWVSKFYRGDILVRVGFSAIRTSKEVAVDHAATWMLREINNECSTTV